MMIQFNDKSTNTESYLHQVESLNLVNDNYKRCNYYKLNDNSDSIWNKASKKRND